MDPNIKGAIIAFLGAIFGALIQAYSHQIQYIIQKCFKRYDLVGLWRGKWYDGSDLRPKGIYIADAVHITKIVNHTLYAVGVVPHSGNYSIKGTFVKANVLQYIFEGSDNLSGSRGGGIMTLNSTRNQFSGTWEQVDNNGGISIGRCVWIKEEQPSKG